MVPSPARRVAAALAFSAWVALAGLAVVLAGCPFARLLHAPCPACGTTRAARALLAGDVAGAFRIHPVAPFVLVLLAALFVRGVVLTVRGASAGRIFEGRAGRALLLFGAACAGLEFAVWIARAFGLFGGPVLV